MSTSLVHALAGSVGGAAAMAVTYPLDQIRTLIQTGEIDASKIPHKYMQYGSTIGPILYVISHKGYWSLYDGCESVLETIGISNFLYFYSCRFLRQSIGLGVLSASTVSAAINTVLTEPLWKATMVIKMSRGTHQSLWTVIHKMASTDGLASLWSSSTVSLWLVSNPVIQFTVYEYLSRHWRGKRGSIGAIEAFLIGAISKSIATITTYPLQIAQTRMRMIDPVTGKPKYTSGQMFQILRELYAHNSLFRGCSAKLYQTVLTAAFMFAFYERIVLLLGKAIQARKIRK